MCINSLGRSFNLLQTNFDKHYRKFDKMSLFNRKKL